MQPEPECSPPFCKVPIFGPSDPATMWCPSPPAMKRVWLVCRIFFHGCRWVWAGFPSHVEVSIFGILPNSLANPQTRSQWKIRLCRENHYPSKFWDACCICCSSVACIYIYISYLFLSAFCWSVFYHDAVKFWTFNPNTEPQQLLFGLDLVDPTVVERRTSQRYQRDSGFWVWRSAWVDMRSGYVWILYFSQFRYQVAKKG